MSTKVISAKIPSEEYDKLIDKCNEKGCSISDYVRERCLAEFNESEKVEEIKESDDAEFKKNIRLEVDLAVAKERIDELKRQNDEFSVLFTPQEIVNRKIHRSANRMKFGCVRL